MKKLEDFIYGDLSDLIDNRNKVLSEEQVIKVFKNGIRELLIKKYGKIRDRGRELPMQTALDLIRGEAQNNKNLGECMEVIINIADEALKNIQ